MVSNKYVDLRKIENSVRNKYCPEDISKVKGKKYNCRKNLQWHLTYKRKRRVILDSDRKLSIAQYYSALL